MPQYGGMDSLAPFFSASGRIAARPFAIRIVIVYALIFASQLLLSQVVMSRVSIAPFVVLQGALTFAWYALHTKRLRDGGRHTAPAFALAVLYAMSVILFILLMALVLSMDLGVGDESDIALLMVFIVLAALAADPVAGLFFYLAVVRLVLVFIPLLIAVAFSLWAGMRPSLPP